MIRRSLGAALWTLVGLLAGFLGALSSLDGTGAGRTLLARVSEGALRQVFTGTAEIGDVHGSLLTGLTLSEVRLFDADTTLVAWLPQVNLSYNPFDFAAGRVVLFEFANDDPNGRLRVRRFEHLDARLAALQVSSPRERGIRIEISRLAVESSDPVVRLADVAGRLGVIGDSMNVQLARVRLPRSA